MLGGSKRRKEAKADLLIL